MRDLTNNNILPCILKFYTEHWIVISCNQNVQCWKNNKVFCYTEMCVFILHKHISTLRIIYAPHTMYKTRSVYISKNKYSATLSPMITFSMIPWEKKFLRLSNIAHNNNYLILNNKYAVSQGFGFNSLTTQHTHWPILAILIQPCCSFISFSLQMHLPLWNYSFFAV